MMNATTALNCCPVRDEAHSVGCRSTLTVSCCYFQWLGGREGFPSTSPPSTSYAHTIQPSYLRQVSHRSKKKHAQGREFSHFSRQKSVLAEKGWEKALQKSDLHIWHQQADFIHRLLKSTLRSIDFKVNFLVILHTNALNPRYPESISIMWIL